MAAAKFNNIRTALYEMVENMTVANGYNNDWQAHYNRDLAQQEGTYLQITTEAEENIDEGGYTASNQYRQNRLLNFNIHLDNPVGVVDLNEVVESCEVALENAKVDILKQYNSCYNIAGNAGMIELKYGGAEIEEDENADMFAPVKMVMKFLVQYIEERGI